MSKSPLKTFSALESHVETLGWMINDGNTKRENDLLRAFRDTLKQSLALHRKYVRKIRAKNRSNPNNHEKTIN